MGRTLEIEVARWFTRLAEVSPEVAQRIGDLMDGVVFDLVLDGAAARILGKNGALLAQSAARGEPGLQIRTSRATVAALTHGTVSLAEAMAAGDLDYHPGAGDLRSRLRVADRIEAAWRLFLPSAAARVIDAELAGSPAPAGAPPASPPPEVRATVTVPTVTVFGAGVTGLTAAQELVERGFRVQVVECEPAARGRGSCEVGGMARTQVVRLPALVDPPVGEAQRGRSSTPGAPPIEAEPFGDGVLSMVSTEPVFALDEHIDFRPNDTRIQRDGLRDGWGRSNGERIVAMVNDLRLLVQRFDEDQATRLSHAQRVGALAAGVDAGPCSIRILVGGHHRGMKPAPSIALRRARAVAAVLRAELGDLASRFEFVPEVIEDREPWSEAGQYVGGELMRADRSDRVDLRVLEERIAPGEHGYRFFPAFYRNLFHTMRRIPLFDDKGRETGHTCYDNLVPTESLLIVPFAGSGTVEVPRRRMASIEGLRKVLRGLYDRLHFEYRDIVLFEMRLFRYMTSCWQRRRQVARDHSWREFIGVHDFTPEFQEFLLDAPQALVAMNAEEIDARTHGNISVQLLLDQLASGNQADMTLNGPTTNAFLKPWKDYLKHHGVRFFLGELRGLRPAPDGGAGMEGLGLPPSARGRPGRMLPIVGRSTKVVLPPGSSAADEPVAEGCYDWMPETDYYVVAVPLEIVWKLLGEMPVDSLDGDFATVRSWYGSVQDEVQAELGPSRIWQPGQDVPRRVDGVPVGPFRDFSGIQFYFNYALQMGATGHVYYVGTPWGLSSFSQPPFWRVRRVLERHRYLAGISIDIGHWYEPVKGIAAHEDVTTAIRTPPLPLAQETWRQILAGFGPEYAHLLRAPAWYHLDDCLVFDRERGHYINAAPFLINRPEEWDRRPGTPLKELLADSPGASPTGWDPGEVDRARHLARATPSGIWYRMSFGQWMLAGTFMKTHTRMTTMEAANESARHAVNQILHHLAHRSRADVDAPPSSGVLMGDYCPTWDPEDNELEDLEPLKRFDARLHERGLPHLLDLLQIERFAQTSADEDSLSRLRGLLDAARDFAGGTGPDEGGGGWLKELEREIKRWMG